MDEAERAGLLEQCQQFDVSLINQLFADLVRSPMATPAEDAADPSFDAVEPELVASKVDMTDEERAALKE